MQASFAAKWFSRGIEALGHDNVYLARTCFEHAASEERKPETCSYLALCQAKTRGTFTDAITLAREAVEGDPCNPVTYLNLGRIYLLAGMRDDAIGVFREGLRRGPCEKIIAELDRLGTRKPSPIPGLARNHPLNKYVGILMARLGFR
ncbi:MAG: hypothetical protein ED859_01780 [Desulfuromonadales bacterium]|nr:MAG: hypothetical protein ED859_01780 [Desulfuromonadales bacterium]